MLAISWPLLAAGLGSCAGGGPGSGGVGDADPAVKIPAMKRAAARQDRSALKQMVADLDSEDPAVRLYAIGALRRLAGEELGYRHWETPEQRRPALERWRQWLASQPGPT